MDIDATTSEYFARIHRAAFILTGNPWDADDLAQETFLVVSRQADRFRGQSGVYTWLYGILLNLDRRRRRQQGTRRRKLQDVWDNLRSRDRSVPAAETAVEVAEWKGSLWARVAELPEGQRNALVLRFAESLAYEQIAQVLGCPLGTVKSRIHHGLLSLRRNLVNEKDELSQVPRHPQEDTKRVV